MKTRNKILIPAVPLLAFVIFYLYIVDNGYSTYVEGIELTRFSEDEFQKYVTEDETSFSKELYISKEEISEMRENNMFFGGHGYNHEWFEHLHENELQIELEKSSHFLSTINNNKDSWLMCYPYGSYNEIVIQHLKKLGFRGGFTTKVSDTLLSKDNAFTLQRYDTNDFPQS